MARWRPDPTFYASPELAMEAPPEGLAYVALLAPAGNGRRDAVGVVDTDPASSGYGRLVEQVELPQGGNELHHFGWNACSSHLCPYAPNAHVERRYLVVPGTHSSRIHVLDTKPDPRRPRLEKVIEGEEVMRRTGYAAPHTVHCGPDGVYMNALGAPDGDGPGGLFMLDHETFELKGRWEHERGPQHLSYDFWWHLGHDTMITSEWGTPNMVKDGVNPELLLAGKYGNALHVWDLRKRTHVQRVAILAGEQQLRVEPVLHHVRRSPFAGDHHLLSEVPPEVVREVLRPPLALPRAAHLERLVIEHEDSAGPVAVRRAERVEVDAVGTAVHRVRRGVARLAHHFLPLDHLHQLRRRRIGKRVQDVDA